MEAVLNEAEVINEPAYQLPTSISGETGVAEACDIVDSPVGDRAGMGVLFASQHCMNKSPRALMQCSLDSSLLE